MSVDGPNKLFMMGFITNLANPKIAIMYLSLLPQFIQPDHGSVLSQSLALGCVQIFISLMVNSMIVACCRFNSRVSFKSSFMDKSATLVYGYCTGRVSPEDCLRGKAIVIVSH
jgi:threonine/homoserine/homoserine lactone efflux protein